MKTASKISRTLTDQNQTAPGNRRGALVLLLLVIFSLQTACGKNPQITARNKIIGGKPVEGRELEHVVAFKRDELTVCTGTLIRSNLVLTAAHCFEKSASNGPTSFANLKVVAGNISHFANSEYVADVVEIKLHPNFWKEQTGALDFAYVTINPPFHNIAPAVLPKSRKELNSVLNQTSKITIAGFGLTTLKLPQEGEPPASGIKNVADTRIQFRTGAEIYAGTRDADSCTGDSGGPAFVKVPKTAENPEGLLLAGVTSRGPMPCASDFEAGAYGNISEALCWLRSSALFNFEDLETSQYCFNELMPDFTPSDEQIIANNDFVSACQDPTLSLNALHNLEVMIKDSGINYSPKEPRTKDLCLNIEKYFKNLTSMDLENQNLKQINWLKYTENLEALFIPDNQIQSIGSLLKLTKLKMLDLRNNRLPNFNELSLLSPSIKIHGLQTQAFNLSQTKYRSMAELGAALGSAKRTTIIALRDMLAGGNIERKSRDLAMKRQLNLENRGLRSIEALSGLENLEILNLAMNPDITDWSILLTLPRLKLLRIALADKISPEVRSDLSSRGVTVIQIQ